MQQRSHPIATPMIMMNICERPSFSSRYESVTLVVVGSLNVVVSTTVVISGVVVVESNVVVDDVSLIGRLK